MQKVSRGGSAKLFTSNVSFTSELSSFVKIELYLSMSEIVVVLMLFLGVLLVVLLVVLVVLIVVPVFGNGYHIKVKDVVKMDWATTHQPIRHITFQRYKILIGQKKRLAGLQTNMSGIVMITGEQIAILLKNV